MKFKTKYINAKELKAIIDKNEDFSLIYVLPPEYHEEEHIIGSLNFDVYAVTFVSDVKKQIKDKNKKIVLYDSSDKSLAAEFASEKLKKEGYKNVLVLKNGLKEWKSNKYQTVKSQIKKTKIEDIKFSIDKEKSFIMWVGRNLSGRHYGFFDKFKAGLEIEGDQLKKGFIEVDTKSIKNKDLEGTEYQEILETHLKSDDFFDVKEFPKASFELTSATKIKEANLGNPNYKIKGKLTIKNITKPIEFKAMLGYTNDGKLSFRAHFDFDRTEFNVIYGSLKYFEKLGMHLVSDYVTIEFFLIGR